jgi:hypothetical protein
MERDEVTIRPAAGRLLVLLPGLGAVATTFLAGLESVRRGLGRPLGSISQLQTIRLGRRSEQRNPLIRDLLPLAALDDLAVAGWDVRPDDALTTARRAGVLAAADLDPVADFLAGIRPMAAAFEPRFARRLEGDNVKPFATKADLVAALRDDIRARLAESGAERARDDLVRLDRDLLEPARRATSRRPRSSDGLDATATRRSRRRSSTPTPRCSRGVPFANGAPNLAVDLPVFEQLAAERRLPIAGKDFKTGQTLLKTMLAPGLQGAHARASTAGSRPTSSATSTAPCSTTRQLPQQGGVEDERAVADPPARALPRALRRDLPQGADQLLPAARRRQGELGQHRHPRLAGLPDADQGQLPLPRLDPGGADRARPRALPRPRGTAPAGTACRSGSRSTSRARRSKPATSPRTTSSSSTSG